MTETEIDRLVIRLVGDGSGYRRMLDTATKETLSFAKTVTGALTGISAAVGAGGVMTAFNELQDNFVRMEAAAKTNGLAIEETIASYKEFAKVMEDTTRTSQVGALSLVAMANSYGLVGAKAEEAVRMATSIAALNPGMSTEGALRAVSMYQKTGYTRQLAYMLGLYGMGAGEGGKGGGARGGANSPAMREEIQKRLNQGWEVATKLTKTLGGQLVSLRSHFKDLEVEIGRIVGDFIQPLVQWTNKLVEWFIDLDPAVKKVILGVVGLGGALALVTPTLTIFSTVLGSVAAGFSALMGLVSWPVILGAGALTAVVAVIIRRLGWIEATWKTIQNGAKLVWGYIKAYFHAFVSWAIPYWQRFSGWLSAKWDDFYEGALVAWDYVKAKVGAFVEWAWPILETWFGFVQAEAELMQEAVAWTWQQIKEIGGAVISWLGEQWSNLTDSVGIDAKDIQDFLVTAFLAGEFAMRNFGKVWDTTIALVAYKMVKWFNDFRFFFTDTVPTLFKWFGQRWADVILSAFAAWQAYTDFIGESLVQIFSNLGNLIRGKVNLADLLAPAADKFQRTFNAAIDNVAQSLPKLPKRAEGDVERVLREEFERSAKGLGESFDQFLDRRMKEFSKFPGLIPPELIRETAKQTKQVGVSLSSPFHEASKEMQKWEAVLFGSAESYARVTEYLDKLSESTEKGGGLIPGGEHVPAGEGARAPEAATPPVGGGPGGESGIDGLKRVMSEYMAKGWPVRATLAGVSFSKLK